MEEKDTISNDSVSKPAQDSQPDKKNSKEKKEKKEATFAPSAIWRELKKVQWPTGSQLVKSSALVIVFTILFGAYFFVCELAASALVSWIVSL